MLRSKVASPLFRRRWTGAATGLVALAAILLAACGSAPRPLPTAKFTDVCLGVGVQATLHGGAEDPRVTWLLMEGGAEKALLWPPRWTARFAPALEVVDPDGRIRFRDGDAVTEVCFAGPPEAPFSTLRIAGL